MERLFFRQRQVELGKTEADGRQGFSRQLNIGVTGLGRSVGTTFVGTALAFYLRDQGKEVSFCQCLTPSKASQLLYDEVSMEQRFLRRNFCDVYEIIRKGMTLNGVKGKGGRVNIEEGISWILPVSDSKEDLTESQQARLLTIPRGEVCIFDFEADYQWNSLLVDMDVIIVVVDPLPSKMIHDKERFRFLKKLEMAGCPVIWVVNRVNDGVNMRQVKGYLKTNQIVQIPAFSVASMYRCEYSCRFPWEDVEIRRKMMEIFTFLFQKMSKYSIML